MLLALKEGQSSLKTACSKIFAKQDVIAKSVDELKEMVAKQQKETFSLKAANLAVNFSHNCSVHMHAD